MQTIPYLSAATLGALNISSAEVMTSIETMIRACQQGTVWSAPKAVILPEDGRYMMAALAAADDPAILAVKSVVLNPRNSERGLPQINGLVTLLDSESGVPVAILDGNWITAVRTAGLSAVAATYMANKNATSAAFIGCGVQAISHLNAFADNFPLQQIKVFGRGQANIDKLCLLAQQKGLTTIQCETGEQAIADAELIISSVTYSADLPPFLDANVMKPGAFATITDLATPWDKDSFAALNRVVIDDLAQEKALANKLLAPEFVSGDLSGLVLGTIQGRSNNQERSAFIFRGHALGDLALSALAWQKHLAANN